LDAANAVMGYLMMKIGDVLALVPGLNSFLAVALLAVAAEMRSILTQ
jgi:hypothetical protein